MLRRFILSDKKIQKDAFIWNAFSAMLNSFQMTLLLVFVTRFGNDRESSIFVMAYAVANLLLHIGKFGIRQFQVTDSNEKYSYKEYEILRKILTVAMLIMAISYAVIQVACGNYTSDKSILIVLICCIRAIEAYEDVIHGRLQQLGRLDVASKILSIRLIVYIVLFAILYILLKDVLIVASISVLVQIFLAVILNRMSFEIVDKDAMWSKSGIKNLFIEVFPLGLAMLLNIYISNSPKYIIDEVVSDAVQTQFNIIFMPVFVVAMLAGFIYQPLVKKMGNMWNSGEIRALNRQIVKISAATVGIALLATGAAYVAGVPVLELVYGVELRQFKIELSVLTFTGGVIALLNILIILITTIRKQKFLLYGYLVVAIVILAFGKKVLQSFDILGICIMFLVMLLLLLLYFVCIYGNEILKQKR